MALWSWLSKRIGRKSHHVPVARRLGELPAWRRARLFAECLEDRLAPASFTDAGTQLNLGLATNESLGIVSNGTNYSLTLASGATWSGTNDANVTGNGTSTLTVTAAGIAAFTSQIQVTDAGSSDSVVFNNSGSFSYANNFNVQLGNATAGSIAFNGTSSFGNFNLTAATTSHIAINASATVQAANGNLDLEANQQSTATTGNFNGIDVAGTVKATGTGGVTVKGRAGTKSTASSAGGVKVHDGGQIVGGTQAALSVMGNGGSGNSSAGVLIGVWLTGSTATITSAGADVDVTGTGGTSSGGYNYGVGLDGNTEITAGGSGAVNVQGTGGSGVAGAGANHAGVTLNGGEITSGGGAITVSGTGGAGTNHDAYGVWVIGSGAQVTSATGNIQINGYGSTTATATANDGILVQGGGKVTSTGAASITLTGTGGSGTNSNFGVEITDTGSAVSSANGAIQVTGQGGAKATGTSNEGVLVLTGGTITSTGTATITLNGTGGSGTDANVGVEINGSGAAVTSANGAIQATGRGSTTATASDNMGVIVHGGGQVRSTGAATITLNGTGGGGTDQNFGVDIYGSGAAVTSATGNIQLNGQGSTTATATNNIGIIVHGGGEITSTGAATVGLSGTGGSGTNDNIGVVVQDTGSAVSSATGNIQVNGQGGAKATGTLNEGIVVPTGGTITSTGTATITLHGIGGSGTDYNFGVEISGRGATVASANGAIQLNGQGSTTATATNNIGIVVHNGGQITSTGAAAVTLSGTGGSGTNYNDGVFLAAAVSSANGNIQINGQGGAKATGTSNEGVFVVTGGTITSTGTATITLNGTGGGGTDHSFGVFLYGSGAAVTSANGNIQVTGQGGAQATGSANEGIVMQNGGTITSTGTATVSVNGTGGSGTDYNMGVNLLGSGTAVTSASGNIQVTGKGGTTATGIQNYGIILQTKGQIASSGSATVTLLGTGGSGTFADAGVALFDRPDAVASVDGDVRVVGIATATAGTLQDGVVASNANQLAAGGIASTGKANVVVLGVAGTNPAVGVGLDFGPSASGATFALTGASNQFVADTMDFDPSTSLNAGTHAVTLRPANSADLAGQANGVGVNLGGADSATQLGLTNAELQTITAGALTIGDASTGAIVVSAPITAPSGWSSLDLRTGAGVTSSASSPALSVTDLNIVAPGGIGAAGTPLSFSGLAALTADTSAHNASQYLQSTGTVTVAGLSAGTGTIDLSGGTFDLSGSAQLNSGATLQLDGGTFGIGSYSQSVARLILNGGAASGSSGVLTSSAVIDGRSGSASAILAGTSGLRKSTAGTLTLTGANSYSGSTTVAAGTLALAGSSTNNVAQSPTLDVQLGATLDVTGLSGGTLALVSGQTLKGDGTVAGGVNAASGSHLAPGESPGVLDTGSISLSSGASFDVVLGGTTAGNGAGHYGQDNVTGTVSLGGATLNLSAFGGFVPAPGDSYVLINNDGTDTVSGTFAGLPEGAIVSTNFLGSGHTARITYQGGDGNDVAVIVDQLAAQATPITAVVGAPFNGAVATFAGNPLAPLANFTATISWGDGTSSTGTISRNGGAYTVSGSHTYAVAGKLAVTVMVSDGNGLTARVVSPATVSSSGQAVGQGQSASVAFWSGSKGQALIGSFNSGPADTQLSGWLAANFGNLYGSLAGQSNSQVAAYYQTLASQAATKPEAEALAAALNVYASTAALGGNAQAAADGFTVSAAGLGAAQVNVGAAGAPLQLYNNQSYSVWTILRSINAYQASKGSIGGSSAMVRGLIANLLDRINTAGGL